MSTNVPTQGLSAPDTGLSSHDYVYDRVVGEDSRTKWSQIAARQKDKVQVIEEKGVTGFDLTRKPDGTYGVMTPKQRAASERSRKFHFKMDAHGRALKQVARHLESRDTVSYTHLTLPTKRIV